MDLKFKPQYTPEKIAYYSHGEGSRALLLAHGSFGSAQMWKMIIPGLVKGGYQVVSLDLQGHGLSKEFDIGSTTMDDYAANIVSVVNVIGKRITLVGHSMSGLVVLMAAGSVEGSIVAIDPSPSVEVQGRKSSDNIPDVYSAMDAGMPSTPEGMSKAMPDMDPRSFVNMPKMLGPESGAARRQRKEGVSITKEKLVDKKVLFLGAELGDSLPFGISAESTIKMAEYYEKPYFEVAGASHPGMLLGKSSIVVVKKILEFLS